MGMNVIIKSHVLRELTAPGDIGGGSSSDKEELTGIYEGKISIRGGIVCISYSEPDGAKCSFSFAKAEPGVVTVTRNFGFGSDSMTTVLEEGRRHISINRILGDSMELTSVCRKLTNTVLKNGKLRLSYSVELHAFRMEKVSVSLDIHKADNK